MMHPIKAALFGAVAGIAVASAVEFNWFGIPGFGFHTAGGTEQIALKRVNHALTPYMVANCVDKFNAQPAAAVEAKLKLLKGADDVYAKGQQLESSWVTFPGESETSDYLIDACAGKLLAHEKQAALQVPRK